MGNRPDRQVLGDPKTNHGRTALFARGGMMATPGVSKKLSPVAPNNGRKGATAPYAQEAARPSAPMQPAFKSGGSVGGAKGNPRLSSSSGGNKLALGTNMNGAAVRGRTKGKIVTMKKGGKC